MRAIQGYLAHKKTFYARTLHEAYAYGPMTVLLRGVYLQPAECRSGTELAADDAGNLLTDVSREPPRIQQSKPPIRGRRMPFQNFPPVPLARVAGEP